MTRCRLSNRKEVPGVACIILASSGATSRIYPLDAEAFHQDTWALRDFISQGNGAPGVQVEGFSTDFNFSYSQKIFFFIENLWKKTEKCSFQIKSFAMLQNILREFRRLNFHKIIILAFRFSYVLHILRHLPLILHLVQVLNLKFFI